MPKPKRNNLAAVPRCAILDPNLTSSEFRVLARVMDRCGAGEPGEYFQAHATTGNELKMDAKTVSRALAKLLRLGYVARRKRPGQSDVYEIRPDVWERNEEFVAQKKSMRSTFQPQVTPSSQPRTFPPDDKEPREQEPSGSFSSLLDEKEPPSLKDESAKSPGRSVAPGNSGGPKERHKNIPTEVCPECGAPIESVGPDGSVCAKRHEFHRPESRGWSA